MDYSEIVELYKDLEVVSGKLEKTRILADFYSTVPKDELGEIVLLSMGIVSNQEIGLASKMVRRIIIKVTGANEKELNKALRETGDLGSTARKLIKNKKQTTLGQKKLTTEKVLANLRKLPNIEGQGSQDRKISLVSELLSSAKPDEAMYIVRTVLGTMRIGVAEGLVRNALAKAFDKEASQIEYAFNILNDYGLVAEMITEDKLSEISIEVENPVRVMLGERAKNLIEAINKFDNFCIETKLDGFRAQIHKKNDVKIFSRRMEDVTKQFPDLVKYCKESLKGDCIVEGEVIAIGSDGRPKPFQQLSKRIQRKYEIEKMVKEIPVAVKLFDVIYSEKDLMDKPLKQRWKKLNSIVKKTKHVEMVEHKENCSEEECKKFYDNALKNGHEGIMVKNLDAEYKSGKRVGYWLKVKPTMEPLDLVITSAEWGKGKRQGWFGSFTLSALKEDRYVPVGKLGTGLTDEEFKSLTKKLKDKVDREEGNTVFFKPDIIIEVEYEEIQKSPNYKSGYALRFPRFKRTRTDKENPDSVSRIKKLYKQQS